MRWESQDLAGMHFEGGVSFDFSEGAVARPLSDGSGREEPGQPTAVILQWTLN